MNSQLYTKFVLEISTQEYHGNLKEFKKQLDILGGC